MKWGTQAHVRVSKNIVHEYTVHAIEKILDEIKNCTHFSFLLDLDIFPVDLYCKQSLCKDIKIWSNNGILNEIDKSFLLTKSFADISSECMYFSFNSCSRIEQF